jgi:hypothetical protein
MNTILTAKDVFNGHPLPPPTYTVKPYIVLSSEGIVLAAGTVEEIEQLHSQYGGYYDHCFVEVRQHDLYMNDNTKITI